LGTIERCSGEDLKKKRCSGGLLMGVREDKFEVDTCILLKGFNGQGDIV
jgi:hypothetical protein